MSPRTFVISDEQTNQYVTIKTQPLTNEDGPVLVAVPLKLNEVARSEEGEEEGCVRPEGF